MNYSTKVKDRLFSIVKQMNSYHWLFTKNPNTDFSRKKKWSFDEIMKFMLAIKGRFLKDELLNYFDFDNLTPSNSSFNQRRAQILPETFEFLFHEFTCSFRDGGCAVYKGCRLIACDCSDPCIAHNPDDKTTYFQSAPDSRGFNQLHLNVFYDLCNRIYVDASIQPSQGKNEDRAMCDLIDRYTGSTAIFIADRNYENYNIFAHTQEKGMYYLIRVSCCRKNRNRKHTYQANYTRAMHICHYFLSVKKEKAPPDVEYLIGHELLPVRTGRSDPRKVKPQSVISFFYRAA